MGYFSTGGWVALVAMVSGCTSVLGVEDLHFVDASTGSPHDAADGDARKPDREADSGGKKDASDAGGEASRDGSSPDSSGKSAAEACMEYAAAWCTKLGSCPASPPGNFFVAVDFPSLASCEMRTAAVCVSALAANGSGQTAEGLGACVAALLNESCTDFHDNNPPAACAPPGTLATGAPCGDQSQCASSFCQMLPGQVCGTCQPAPMLGQSCIPGGFDQCGRDQLCLTPSGLPSACSPYVSNNGACLGGVNACEFGSVCVGSNAAMMMSGVCKAQGSTSGAVCDTSVKTDPNCASGFVCAPGAGTGNTIGTCKTETLVGTGKACGPIGSAPVTGSALCTGGDQCVNKLCVAPAADGAACNTSSSIGPPCLSPAKCVLSPDAGTAGTCVFPNATMCM